MGDWTIVVSGQGSHHNGMPGDADRLAQRLVDELVEAQQTIRYAAVTYGGHGPLDLITPERDRFRRYIDARPDRHMTNDGQAEKYERMLEDHDRVLTAKARHQRDLLQLPNNVAKQLWDQDAAAGLVRQWRYQKGKAREVSVDGGKTWEAAPEDDDIIAALRVLMAENERMRRDVLARPEPEKWTDHEVTLVFGNMGGLISRLVDKLGIREAWEEAASELYPTAAERTAAALKANGEFDCNHRDDYGSLIVDGVCMVCGKRPEQSPPTILGTPVRGHGETRTRAHAKREEAGRRPPKPPANRA